MPGGEALARQFVLGKQFFLDEFGLETEEVWLPDSFGYSAALPQIVGRVGLALVPDPEDLLEPDQPHARTTPSGGRASTAPGSSPTSRRWTPTTPICAAATWRGPQRQYARRVRGNHLAGAVRLGRRRRRADPGDARRGAHRTADLEGSPTVDACQPAGGSSPGPRPSTRSRRSGRGELYLEFHRGTYTAQARTKRGNRRSEHLLREAELWATTAAVRAGAAYPVRRAATGLGDGAAAAVPRHPARHARSPGCTARPSATTRPVAADADGDHRASAAAPGRAPAIDCIWSTPTPHAGARRARAGRHRGRHPGASRRRRACATATVVLENGAIRVDVDRRGLITSLIEDRRAGRGDRPRRRGRQPAPAAPGHPRQLGRVGHRRALPPTPGRPGEVDRSGRRASDGDHVRRLRSGSPVEQTLALAPGAPSSTSTSRSTGTSGRSCSSWPSRWTCMPNGPPRRSSSATSSGRPTPTPPGMRPGSRPSPTGGCTSASPATAWRWPTTAPTATTSPGSRRPRRPGDDHDGPAVPAARAAVPRPVRRPGRAHAQRLACGSVPPSATRSARATAGTSRRGRSRTPPGRSIHWSRVAATAIVVETVKLAEDGSGDVVVRAVRGSRRPLPG